MIVPHDVAEQRVADAIAAGGTLVTDEFARSWWILADADGNEACVCTWQDRSTGTASSEPRERGTAWNRARTNG